MRKWLVWELLKNVSQLSLCARYRGHIGTRDWAHWDYKLVKGNKCKLGGKYIFVNKVQTRNMWQPACRMNLKQYCQNNIRENWKDLDMKCQKMLSISLSYSGAHWDNVPLCPEEIVPICPTCSWKSNQGKMSTKNNVRIENFTHGHANITCY